MDVYDGSESQVRINWRVGKEVTMPLLLDGSRTAIKYGQPLESFVIIDPEGNLRYKSNSSVSMDKIRDEVALALSELPQTTVELVQAAGWQHALPDTAIAGDRLEIDATVVPALFSEGGEIVRVVADLSGLGGEREVPLQATDEGTYRLQQALTLGISYGLHPLEIVVEQQTPDGPVETRLSQMILVVPAHDLPIFASALAENWTLQPTKVEVAVVDDAPAARDALALMATERWSLVATAAQPVQPLGLRALRFAFHPGDATGGFFNMVIKGARTILVGAEQGIDLERREWQEVEVPLEWDFSADDHDPIRDIASIIITGDLVGTFYMSDIRLLSAREEVVPTAILESYQASTPDELSLAQNYPNPFNSETVIAFALPERAQVELSVYNMLGQQISVLLRGPRSAGSFSVRWDGRDRAGRALASGVYFYRLQVGQRQEIRKLLLLR